MKFERRACGRPVVAGRWRRGSAGERPMGGGSVRTRSRHGVDGQRMGLGWGNRLRAAADEAGGPGIRKTSLLADADAEHAVPDPRLTSVGVTVGIGSPCPGPPCHVEELRAAPGRQGQARVQPDGGRSRNRRHRTTRRGRADDVDRRRFGDPGRPVGSCVAGARVSSRRGRPSPGVPHPPSAGGSRRSSSARRPRSPRTPRPWRGSSPRRAAGLRLPSP